MSNEGSLAQPPQVIPILLGMAAAFLVKSKRVMLVDTGLPGRQRLILETIAANGLLPADVSLILLTHAHGDHAGSVAALKEATGALVAIHRLDADFLRRGGGPLPSPISPLGRVLRPLLARVAVRQIRTCEPDLLIDDELDLTPYGIAGRAIHTQGHTPGSVSVLLADGAAIVGDLLSGGRLGHRRPGYPIFGEDVEQMKASVRRLQALAPTYIYPAHGAPFDGQALQAAFPREG